MRVETELIDRTKPAASKSALKAELASWTDLFGPGLRVRTWIAIMVMFFQRKHHSSHNVHHHHV
jgi:hypothetical protein